MDFLKANITVPIKFVSAGQFVSDRPWRHNKRVVDSFELMVGIRETLYMEQNRQQFELKPGGVLLLQPGSVHRGYADSAPKLSFFWCHFYCHGYYEMVSREDIRRQFGDRSFDTRARDYNAEINVPVHFHPPSIERINILFHQLLHVSSSDYYTGHSAHYMLTSLLIEVSQQALNHFVGPTGRSQDDVNLAKIQEWVRVNALNNITVSKVADEFNYNKNYLSRYFKRKTGRTLTEYIMDLKMTRAKQMLTHSSMNVKEIAELVGFSDDKYFMRMFKKYENMTPSEFRNAYYNTHMNNR